MVIYRFSNRCGIASLGGHVEAIADESTTVFFCTKYASQALESAHHAVDKQIENFLPLESSRLCQICLLV